MEDAAEEVAAIAIEASIEMGTNNKFQTRHKFVCVNGSQQQCPLYYVSLLFLSCRTSYWQTLGAAQFHKLDFVFKKQIKPTIPEII